MRLRLTTQCEGGPASGTALFPPGVAPPPAVRVQLKGNNGKRKTLKPGQRADRGAGAICVEQSVYSSLGGGGQEVEVVPLSRAKALLHDPQLRLDFAIAVLTAVGVIIAALFAYAKNIKPDNPPLILKLAPFLLAIVVIGALLKLRNDLRSG
jgi:hypothetical protein